MVPFSGLSTMTISRRCPKQLLANMQVRLQLYFRCYIELGERHSLIEVKYDAACVAASRIEDFIIAFCAGVEAGQSLTTRENRA
jgi:hypothetical protein